MFLMMKYLVEMVGLLHFCKTYKIKEHRRHGEAGSVDLEAVGKE
jgi:hypothetical protein